MNYAFLGLGFVQGWLWLFFLSGPLLFSEAEGWSINNELIILSFLLANSLSYLWVTKKTKKSIESTPLYSRNLMLITSALLMAGGVLMIKSTAGQLGEVQYVVLALFGTVVAGYGSAILIVALGELFSFFSVTVAGLSFAGSVTVGTALFFVALKLSIPIAFLLTAFSPIIALAFIFLGRRQILKADLNNVMSSLAILPLATSTTTTSISTSTFTFPFPRKLTFLLILFYLAGGLFYKMILLSSASALQESYWFTNVIYCLAIIIAGGCLYLFPNLDLSILYRPVLPLLGAGFVLIPFFHELSVFLPLTFLQTGFALFDLYTWLLFAYMAKYYQRPAYVFGWGMFLITISIFVGETLFATLFAKLTFYMEEIEIVSLCAALLMMAGTMLFQGKRDSFAGWEAQTSPEQVSIEMASTLNMKELEVDEVNELDKLVKLNEMNELIKIHHQKLEMIKNESSTKQRIDSTNTNTNTNANANANALKEQFFLTLELTKREKDVAVLLFEGRNNPYIRGTLNISNNTLKTHLKNIYRKAMINDRQQLLDFFNEFVSGKE